MPASTSASSAKQGTAIRVRPETHAVFSALAMREHKPMTQYLAEVAERERERVYWDEFREAVAQLKADPEAWAAYKEEARELDGTLMDGMAADEDWSDLRTATW